MREFFFFSLCVTSQHDGDRKQLIGIKPTDISGGVVASGGSNKSEHVNVSKSLLLNFKLLQYLFQYDISASSEDGGAFLVDLCFPSVAG